MMVLRSLVLISLVSICNLAAMEVKQVDVNNDDALIEELSELMVTCYLETVETAYPASKKIDLSSKDEEIILHVQETVCRSADYFCEQLNRLSHSRVKSFVQDRHKMMASFTQQQEWINLMLQKWSIQQVFTRCIDDMRNDAKQVHEEVIKYCDEMRSMREGVKILQEMATEGERVAREAAQKYNDLSKVSPEHGARLVWIDVNGVLRIWNNELDWVRDFIDDSAFWQPLSDDDGGLPSLLKNFKYQNQSIDEEVMMCPFGSPDKVVEAMRKAADDLRGLAARLEKECLS